jgi:hypothetical protein
MYKFNIYSRNFNVNGLDIGKAQAITENPESIDINLKESEHIIIYSFSRLMLANPSKCNGPEHFEFTGPRLGFYHDTADVREGPYVNHFIHKLSVDVLYQGCQVVIGINGEADLSYSSIDDYWYKGEKEGIWGFSGGVVYEYYE